MTNEGRQAHVDQLAAELGCVTVQQPNMPGMMFVEYEPPVIEGPIIASQSDYLTMLHELGHVARGHTQGRPPFTEKTFYFDNGVLRSEAEAWEWALDHCREEDELDTTARAFMWRRCMGSYYQGSRIANGRGGQQLWNGNRHHVLFAYDKPDVFFWSVAQRMAGNVVQLPSESEEFLVAA